MMPWFFSRKRMGVMGASEPEKASWFRRRRKPGLVLRPDRMARIRALLEEPPDSVEFAATLELASPDEHADACVLCELGIDLKVDERDLHRLRLALDDWDGDE